MRSDIEEEIRRELDDGERILWSGRPVQGFRLRSIDAFMLPFGLLWFGMVIFMSVTVLRSPKGVGVASVMLAPFFLFGAYICFGRYLLDARRRAREVYALTDRRVLILNVGSRRSVQDLPLRTLGPISLDEKRDGRGDIWLGTSDIRSRVWAGSGWPGAAASVPFLDGVKDAREVFKCIRSAQAPLLRPTGLSSISS